MAEFSILRRMSERRVNLSGGAEEIRQRRRLNDARQVLLDTGFYHSFEMPDGTRIDGAIPLEDLKKRLGSFPIPEDLTGKTVLDIGPWDGFFTFAMERRGAAVTAIDYVDLDSFRLLAERFASRARYLRMEVYELDPGRLGRFDYVLFLGVLYHLKHPQLAMEKVCAMTEEMCVVDTHVSNASQWLAGERAAFPSMDLYEHDELAGQLDNWCGPTVEAVQMMARVAGFASAEVLYVGENTARVAAWRKWRNLPEDREAAPMMRGLTSHWNGGRTFSSAKEEYVSLWSEWEGAVPELGEVWPEVDEFGVAPLAVSVGEGGLQVSFRLPPGLAAGRHTARFKVGERGWSERVELFVDLVAMVEELQLVSLQDGVTWALGESGGWLTVWVEGLTAEADRGNTVVEIGGIPHVPGAVEVGSGQVNVELRSMVREGRWMVRVRHRGAVSGEMELVVNRGDGKVLQ